MVTRLLPLLLCIFLGWIQAEGQRLYLLIAGICWIFITIYTLVYIYPINDILFKQAGGNNSAEMITGLVKKWLFADRLRFVAGTVGYLCLLHAFRSKA